MSDQKHTVEDVLAQYAQTAEGAAHLAEIEQGKTKANTKKINTTSKIINILHVGMIFCSCGLDFSKNKANFAQFEGNHCAFLFILTYNSEILCKFAAS